MYNIGINPCEKQGLFYFIHVYERGNNMRTIRNRKVNKSIVRKINNLFDSAMYNTMWGDVQVLGEQDKSFDPADYIRFLKLLGIMHKMSFALRHTRHRMSVDVLPYPIMRKPEAVEYKGKVYYGVVFNGWESEYHFDIDMGDTIYMRMSIDKQTGEFDYDILHCEGCGRPITEDKYIFTEDTHHIYCHDCEGDYYYECEECGEYFDEEYYEAENDDRHHICHNCFDWITQDPDEWYRCEDCDEVRYGDGTWANNMYGDHVIVCEYCRDRNYRWCEDCEEFYPEEEVSYLEGVGATICDGCRDDHYVQCDNCGCWMHENDANYDDEGDHAYCNECWDDHDYHARDHFTGRVIRRYHDERGDDDEDTSAVGTYDMDFLVETTRQDDPTIGTELEADEGGKNDDNAEEILEILGDENCIASEDASIEHGFEIVSRPAQLRCHKNIIDWERALDRLRELGYKSHDCGTCGIHTHIDRDFFEGETKDDVDSKFIITLQNNFWWLRRFSRRDDTNGRWQYCALNTNNYLNDNDKMDKESVKNKAFIEQNKSPRWCHRLSVNVDHTNTVEIRLYRGTLVYNTFIATLECSDLWARLVKGKTIEESTEIELKDFISLAEKMEYTEFLTYLNKRNIRVSEEPQRRLVRYLNAEDYHYVNF